MFDYDEYEDYEPLREVLSRALEQAAKGKGRERHANNKPILEQPNQTTSDTLNTYAGLVFQAHKKSAESLNLDEPDRKINELLGAINYLAFAVLWIERHRSDVPACRRRSCNDQ